VLHHVTIRICAYEVSRCFSVENYGAIRAGLKKGVLRVRLFRTVHTGSVQASSGLYNLEICQIWFFLVVILVV
jgi:hypothetical protein